MSAVKHTPGPWKLKWENLNDYVIEAPMDESHIIACGINNDYPVGSPERKRAVLNIQVMTAAPEMIEALELALEYWADRQQRYKNRSPIWVQKARAVIAKATGEQP